MSSDKKLQLSLAFMRLTIFLVMLMWTLDKFLNPEHAAAVYANFYFLPGLGETAFYIIGLLELIVLLMFLVGYQKTLSYAAVLIFHAVSTLSSFRQYLDPFAGSNLLFFAAWPMLAACLALFLMRRNDRMLAMS